MSSQREDKQENNLKVIESTMTASAKAQTTFSSSLIKLCRLGAPVAPLLFLNFVKSVDEDERVWAGNLSERTLPLRC